MAQQQQNIPRGLPPSLFSTFKSIHKLYEQNQYKRALKAAESILRQKPNHGETLSMKGLILNSLNRKKEAYNCARKGLRNDILSYLCWHILGILYRSDRLYLDATKCFENAILYQKDNRDITLLRDLATMYIQNRQYDAFMKTSLKLLTAKPTTKFYWSAYAVASHLAGDYEKSIQVIESYDNSIEKSGREKFERGEILFYKVIVIEESGDIKRALEELEKHKNDIVDKEEWKSKRAEYLYKLNMKEEAAGQYQILIKGNSDCWEYFLGLFKSLELIPDEQKTLHENICLDKEKTSKIIELCDNISKECPYGKAARQIPLSFISGNEFREKFHKFACANLTKGVPALFKLVKYLYKNSEKVAIIEEVFQEIRKNLEETNKLSPKEELEEPPTSVLWTWHFLAEHYNITNRFDIAFSFAEKCIKHTPTVLDFELLKAKIYKRAGDVVEASKCANEARTMDLADRYLNTKCTRYLLRADNVKQAEQTISIFTKVEQEPQLFRNNIFDMQVFWYEYEEALSWFRQGKFGLALKRLVDTKKQFIDIHSDQVDFHTFCNRKMTLRQYLRMLRLEDRLYGHQFFFKAVCQIVKIYLHLQENPINVEKTTIGENITENEKKKLQNKLRKEAARKKKVEEMKKQQQKQQQITDKTKKDDDPNGDKLINVASPLTEAHKYLSYLLKYSDNELQTHLLGFQVAIHRQKYLLALRSVIKGHQLQPNHPQVHMHIVKFFHAVSNNSTLLPHVKTVVEVESKAILGERTLSKYNDDYLAVNGHTVAGRKAYFECAILIKSHKKDDLLDTLCNTDDPGYPLEYCIEIHKFLLKEFGENQAGEYKKNCHNKFPYARYFSDKQEEPEKQPIAKEPEDEDPNLL